MDAQQPDEARAGSAPRGRCPPRTAQVLAAAAFLLAAPPGRAWAQADGAAPPASSPGTKAQSESEPSTCGACGTGLVAAGLLLTSPLSVTGALALLAATQLEWIEVDPSSTYGIPLWGYGLGCAAGHVFLATVASLAFWRDLFVLCGSISDDIEEDTEIEVVEEGAPPVEVRGPPAGRAPAKARFAY